MDIEEAVTLDYDEFNPLQSENETELPPIIFLHGFMWNRKLYQEIVEILCERTGRKVYSLDLRNHGTSPRIYAITGPEIHALDLKKFMQDHAIDKASFVCHSYSSVGAHIVAMENPEAVEKIVMVDHLPDCTGYLKSAVKSARKMVHGQNRILRYLRNDITLSQAKTKILNLGRASVADEVIMRKMANDLTKENGKFKWTIDIDFLLHSIENVKFYIQPEETYHGEILLIRSLDDSYVPDEHLEGCLRLNPRLRMKVYEEAGHLLMFEEQDQFLDDVVEFLKNE